MRRDRLNAPSGVLLVDKPVGPTSHDVVAVVRRTTGIRRVGHTGTLDPFASGLLVLCVGPATRLVEYFHLLPKTYVATMELGERRSTDDLTGEVTAASDSWRGLGDDEVARAVQADLGDGMQRPPDFSALRKEGRRAHEAARSGQPLVIDPRPVRVDEATVLSREGRCVEVRYVVSTGTYIRALARDLGERLGCHAHLAGLRRTRIGPLSVADAVAPSEGEVEGRGWLTPLEALAWLPRRILDPAELTEIAYGRDIADSGAPDGGEQDLPVVLDDGEGRLAAVARRRDDRLRPEKVFHAG